MDVLNTKRDSIDGVLSDDDELLFAGEWNQVATEGQNLITSSGQVLTASDLTQMAKAVAAYSVAGDTYIDSGTVNTYILSPSNDFLPITEYFNGSIISFIAISNNTGASTVNAADLGEVPFCNLNGDPLEDAQIEAGQRITIYFDAVRNQFKLLNNIDVGEESLVPQNTEASLGLLVAMSGNVIQLNWNVVPDATQYRIEVFDNGQLLRQVVFQQNQTSYNYRSQDADFDGVPDLRNFDFVVTPFNVIGNGISGSGSQFVAPPSQVTGFTAGNITTETADFSWNAINGVAGYILYQVDATGNTIDEFRFELYNDLAASVTLNVDDFDYAVAAYDVWSENIDDLNFSDVLSVTAEPEIQLPPQHTLGELNVVATLASDGNSINVDWNVVPDATQYRIETVVNGVVVRLRNQLQANNTFVYTPADATADGVFGQRDFTFDVTPFNDAGDGLTGSDDVSINSLAAPVLDIIDEDSFGDAIFTWSSIPSASSYILFRVSNTNNNTILGTEFTGNALTYETNVANNGEESWRVAGVDAWGGSGSNLNLSNTQTTMGESDEEPDDDQTEG